VAVDSGTPKWNLFYALGVAFLAGILFNVVPCVLPMLPIKVLGFAEISGHDPRKTVGLAGVFGLGIVSVFAVLAVLILALKALTWGSQFSNPYFAWGMVVLLLVMSLWLFGFFTFNLPAGAYAFAPRHDTYFGNYLWGILTAVFSTPCTGPLFPPILLWAQGQPTYVGVPGMLMVGVGMAFPYVLLSAFPQAARRFPRVGPWSELFKQMLGFVLLGFTVFFAVGRLTSSEALWWSVVPVAVLAGVYLMARTVQLSTEARAVGISSVIAVGMVTATVLVACRFSGVFDPRPTGAAGASTGAVSWVPYSDATLEAARAQGKIVLVKFTANWCMNCKFIEGTVYHDARALAALREHDVVTLKADLTAPQAPGSKRLMELEPTGGIPLTAIYAPGYDQPILISSVYTTSTLVQTLDQLGQVKTASAR
jgi:thiol:disulfide interchange protein DsbD